MPQTAFAPMEMGKRMVSRRDVLVAGGGGIAALGLGLGSNQAAARAPFAIGRPALLLVDTTLSGTSRAIAAAQHAGVPVVSFAGDLGTVWLSHLEPLWRAGPHPVAGVTYGGALFCVEHLARSNGMACIYRSRPGSHETQGSASGPADAVSLLLARTEQPRAERAKFADKALQEAGDLPLAWLIGQG
jgi:hypothetical protein